MFGIWQWFTLRFMVPPPNLIWHLRGCLCNLWSISFLSLSLSLSLALFLYSPYLSVSLLYCSKLLPHTHSTPKCTHTHTAGGIHPCKHTIMYMCVSAYSYTCQYQRTQFFLMNYMVCSSHNKSLQVSRGDVTCQLQWSNSLVYCITISNYKQSIWC